jgi:hypothetical protein
MAGDYSSRLAIMLNPRRGSSLTAGRSSQPQPHGLGRQPERKGITGHHADAARTQALDELSALPRLRDAIYRAQQRGASHVVRERVTAVAERLMRTGSLHDPARDRLLETRKSVVGGWLEIADALDLRGELVWPARRVILRAICRAY